MVAALSIALKLVFSTSASGMVVEHFAQDRNQLQGDLSFWARDLRLFAQSLVLHRWPDVRHGLRWCTVAPPASLTEASDWLPLGVVNSVRHRRICIQAEELAGIAVIVDGEAVLPGAANVNEATVTLSSTDYARAVALLVEDVELLCADLAATATNAQHSLQAAS